ncbi:MAG TPA: 50S ribosomal protein L13 [bacterium]|nr:50S ribosomal protein L13 [bacterium]
MERKWYLIDATDRVLGRLATFTATLLQGKHLPQFTPHLDEGAGVIIINAEHIRITGNKLKQKTYFRHSGYPGGEKIVYMGELFRRSPETVIRYAVEGMLPKNKHRDTRMKRLKVYCGVEHSHTAQNPQKIEAGTWKQFTQ